MTAPDDDPIARLVAHEAGGGAIGPDDRRLCEEMSARKIRSATKTLALCERRGIAARRSPGLLSAALAMVSAEPLPAHRYRACRDVLDHAHWQVLRGG